MNNYKRIVAKCKQVLENRDAYVYCIESFKLQDLHTKILMT